MQHTLARLTPGTLLATGATLSLLTLAACGGSGGGGSGGDAGLTKDKMEAAGLSFAKCMREHGVDMPDPVDGKIELRSDPSNANTVDNAQKACSKYLEQVRNSIPAAEKAKMRDRGVKFAQCMRSHGIDVPDPDADGGIKVTRRAGDGASNSMMQKAQEACQSILGDGPGRDVKQAPGGASGDGGAPSLGSGSGGTLGAQSGSTDGGE